MAVALRSGLAASSGRFSSRAARPVRRYARAPSSSWARICSLLEVWLRTSPYRLRLSMFVSVAAVGARRGLGRGKLRQVLAHRLEARDQLLHVRKLLLKVLLVGDQLGLHLGLLSRHLLDAGVDLLSLLVEHAAGGGRVAVGQVVEGGGDPGAGLIEQLVHGSGVGAESVGQEPLIDGDRAVVVGARDSDAGQRIETVHSRHDGGEDLLQPLL